MLTVNDLMERFAVKRTTVYSMVGRGELPQPIKVGGSVRWLPEEIDAAVERWKAQRATPAARGVGRPRKIALETTTQKK
jgi:predicted DNA-binding transcriptional regulator AlpA